MLAAITAALLGGCSSVPSQDAGGVQTFSDQTDVRRSAHIRLQLAVGYFQQGQLNIALDEIKQSLQIDPGFADAYSMRGLIYMEMGELRLAEESFREALRLTPGNPDFSNNYGWFLCQTGREKESIAYFEAALQKRTYQSPAKALNNAGVCSLKQNNVAAAEQYLKQAFQIEPGNPETNANLALVHQKQGDNQNARFYINRVLKSEDLSSRVLWTAIKVERALGDRAAENSLATQLRRRYPKSPEFAAYMRGAFDE